MPATKKIALDKLPEKSWDLNQTSIQICFLEWKNEDYNFVPDSRFSVDRLRLENSLWNSTTSSSSSSVVTCVSLRSSDTLWGEHLKNLGVWVLENGFELKPKRYEETWDDLCKWKRTTPLRTRGFSGTESVRSGRQVLLRETDISLYVLFYLGLRSDTVIDQSSGFLRTVQNVCGLD